MIVAPCRSQCENVGRCRKLETCDAWKMFKKELELEREGKKMKCPKCHRDMKRKEYRKGVYFFECPNCHHTVGKPKEDSNEEKRE